ncbi:MAG: hypothetical protein IKW30_04475 [Lachnospiraceae bacterium]|nr:hypothetical protein [Lachnospiraceae bacterium]
MSLCESCRNLIDVMDSRTVSCEAYIFSVESKEECSLFLNSKCKDKRKIQKNIDAVDRKHLSEYEDLMLG